MKFECFNYFLSSVKEDAVTINMLIKSSDTESWKAHLNQLHQRNRVKKMKSTKSVLSLGNAGYFCYW